MYKNNLELCSNWTTFVNRFTYELHNNKFLCCNIRWRKLNMLFCYVRVKRVNNVLIPGCNVLSGACTIIIRWYTILDYAYTIAETFLFLCFWMIRQTYSAVQMSVWNNQEWHVIMTALYKGSRWGRNFNLIA